MNLKPLYAVMAVFFAAGVICLFVILHISPAAPDIPAYNDIASTLGEHWNTLDAHNLPGKQYRLDYAVLDLDGNVRAATRAGLGEASVAAAVRRRDTVLDIRTGNTVVGNVLFYDDAARGLQSKQQTLEVAGLLMLLLPLLFCAGYALWLKRRLIRPFRQLDAFARRVAAGNLDVPLKMDQTNLFGPFTEAFDLMRTELKRAQDEAYRANQSKKELVASLSHDIKTPAASILATAELMLVRERDAAARKNWETVRAKAEQIDLLITNLFHASLEELQKLRVEPAHANSALLGDMLRTADYNGHAAISPILPCMLRFDRLRLQQVFDNVINNSYKYAATAIRINFAFGGDSLAVTISDSGPGVPPECLPLVCNKFYRGPGAAGKSGSGLGLYLSRYLMEQMGGSLSCCNLTDGKTMRGFSVCLRIPLSGAVRG